MDSTDRRRLRMLSSKAPIVATVAFLPQVQETRSFGVNPGSHVEARAWIWRFIGELSRLPTKRLNTQGDIRPWL
jgi:hypothetical protein